MNKEVLCPPKLYELVVTIHNNNERSDKKRHKIRGRVEEGIIYFLILFIQKRQIFIETESRSVVAEGWLEEWGKL